MARGEGPLTVRDRPPAPFPFTTPNNRRVRVAAVIEKPAVQYQKVATSSVAGACRPRRASRSVPPTPRPRD